MNNILYKFDVLVSTTTQWNDLGQFSGYTVTKINLYPVHAIIGILILMALFTFAVWPKIK
jgi:cytochrome b561